MGIILSGLTLGYVVQQMHRTGRLTLPVSINALRITLQKLGILGIMAPSFALAVWVISIPDMRLFALPFLGLGALLFGGLLAVLYSKLLGHDDKKAGAMFGCGSFSNIGAVGALVCLVFLGEEAYAMVALYKLFEEVYYYGVGFPACRWIGTGASGSGTFGKRLAVVLSDEFVRTILAAILIGAALNFSGVPRPAFLKTVNSLLVPIGTFVLLASIGLGMRFKSATSYLRECAALMSVKFLLVPAAATGCAVFLGFGDLLGGMPLRVVLICSSMPVAVNAMIPPSLYDLDLDLANSCWLVTNFSLAVTLPLLYCFFL